MKYIILPHFHRQDWPRPEQYDLSLLRENKLTRRKKSFTLSTSPFCCLTPMTTDFQIQLVDFIQ